MWGIPATSTTAILRGRGKRWGASVGAGGLRRGARSSRSFCVDAHCYNVPMNHLTRGMVRGVALFLGLFSAANILVSRFGTARVEDIWWIDASSLPPAVASTLAALAAVTLVMFGLAPSLSMWRRILTVGVAGAYVFLASSNAVSYYHALRAGSFDPAVPVPFSLVVAALFALVGLSALFMGGRSANLFEHLIAVLFLSIGIVGFPVAQMGFFGTTDYATKADAAIVFGARVYPDGTLSAVVRDRMDTAIALYDRGLVPTLIITGGIDADGVDETEGMRNYAIAHGVPAGDITVDNAGFNTDASAANTVLILRDMGAESALAVSQFYHLPRIKMAYRALHVSVRTVPAGTGEYYGVNTAMVLREIPAFWVYWFRSGARDVWDASFR